MIEVYKKIEKMTDEKWNKLQEEVMNMKMPEIRALKYKGTKEEITYEYDELTAICPATGIQDLYKLKIKYVPEKKYPELKSLRFYFLGYRDVPITHEHLASKIWSDFYTALDPQNLEVRLSVAVRGGIKTTIRKCGK